jgi:hypothetical protein
MTNVYRKLTVVATGATLGFIAMGVNPAQAVSLKELTNLESFTFFERTGGTQPRAYTFSVDSPELLNRRSTLNSSSNDFGGALTEYYDVFYSDAEGNFNIDGEYMTIEAVFSFGLPAGGGLNLAEMRLNFADDSSAFANQVTSFRSLGNNGDPNSVANAIDGDLLTHTRMGNTSGQNERLSITLGYTSESVPEPLTLLGSATALGFGAFLKREHSKRQRH